MQEKSPIVVQYCSTLHEPCGIATYTEMLAEAQGMKAVRTLEELEDIRCTHLHLQHEFGIYSVRRLQEIADYCDAKGIALFVTMHTVIPLPTTRQYYKFRITRRWPFFEKRHRLYQLALRPFEWCLQQINVILRGNLRLWKRWVALKQWVGLAERCPSIRWGKLWVWDEENPDYDRWHLRHFRKSQELIIARSAGVVVHQKQGKNVLEKMGATNVQIVPHGIQNKPVSPVLHSDTDGYLHVGCFGHLKQGRGVMDIIDACSRLENVKLHIFASTKIANNQDAYLKRVMKQIDKYDWIELNTAHLPLDKIIWELSRCDVNVWYCNPPGGISASGSLCQYIAAKRPIIASQNVMVHDRRDALTMVPTESPSLLSFALRESTAEHGVAALERYCKNHEWRNTKAIYNSTDRTTLQGTLGWRFRRPIRNMQNLSFDDFNGNEMVQYLIDHPEYQKNPLAAYEHSCAFGNPNAKPNAKRLVFLHFQKTAGSTLNEIIRANARCTAFRHDSHPNRSYPGARKVLEMYRVLPSQLQEMERKKWSRYDVVSGHSMFGIHELFDGDNLYATMLRNPVDRLLSYYRFIRRPEEQTKHGNMARSLSFIEFIESEFFQRAYFWSESYVALLTGQMMRKEIDQQDVEQAKNNLSTFNLVLLTEHFDQSVELLCTTLGWKDAVFGKDGTLSPREDLRVGLVTGGANARDQLSPQELEAAKYAVRYDMELYEYATVLFAEVCKQQKIASKHNPVHA